MNLQVVDKLKAQYVVDLLKKNERADGRSFFDYREIKIDKDIFKNCEGSALCNLGDTKVLAGVKIDLATPFPDKPGEGMLTVSCEFAPLAHPLFTPGPPDERAIEVARVVDRGIRAANVIDLKKLFIAPGKVLGVFIDLYMLDHNGNLIDASALATMSALNNCVLPKVEKDGDNYKLNREDRTGKLPIGEQVVTCTFEKINNSVVLDGPLEEENASDGRLTLGATKSGLICSAQKSGSAAFSFDEFDLLVDKTLEKSLELFELV